MDGREQVHLISAASDTLSRNHAMPPGLPERSASLGMTTTATDPGSARSWWTAEWGPPTYEQAGSSSASSDRRGSLMGSCGSRRRVSVGPPVLQAIDERFPGDADERRAALRAILDAEPMDVPDPDQLHDELEVIRSRHLAGSSSTRRSWSTWWVVNIRCANRAARSWSWLVTGSCERGRPRRSSRSSHAPGRGAAHERRRRNGQGSAPVGWRLSSSPTRRTSSADWACSRARAAWARSTPYSLPLLAAGTGHWCLPTVRSQG